MQSLRSLKKTHHQRVPTNRLPALRGTKRGNSCHIHIICFFKANKSSVPTLLHHTCLYLYPSAHPRRPAGHMQRDIHALFLEDTSRESWYSSTTVRSDFKQGRIKMCLYSAPMDFHSFFNPMNSLCFQRITAESSPKFQSTNPCTL